MTDDEIKQRYPIHAQLKEKEFERMVVQKFLDWLYEEAHFMKKLIMIFVIIVILEMCILLFLYQGN